MLLVALPGGFGLVQMALRPIEYTNHSNKSNKTRHNRNNHNTKMRILSFRIVMVATMFFVIAVLIIVLHEQGLPTQSRSLSDKSSRGKASRTRGFQHK